MGSIKIVINNITCNVWQLSNGIEMVVIDNESANTIPLSFIKTLNGNFVYSSANYSYIEPEFKKAIRKIFNTLKRNNIIFKDNGKICLTPSFLIKLI